MKRELRFVGLADRSTWAAVAAGCPWATYFHRPEWTELWAQVERSFQACAWAFEIDDDQPLILPGVLEQRRGWRDVMRSMYPWVYGGPIAVRELTAREWQALGRWLNRPRMGAIQVNGSPYYQPPLMSFPRPTAIMFTHRLDIRPGWQAVFAAFEKKSARWGYRRGVDLGVTCRIASNRDDYAQYTSLYAESIARWGKTATIRYPDTVFQALCALRDTGATLWLADYQGTIVAGAIVLYHGNTAIYWHGASSEIALRVQANNVLQGTIIAEACQRSVEWYDFNPSAGLEGVIRFKESFGAQPVEFPVWEFPQIRLVIRRLVRGHREPSR